MGHLVDMAKLAFAEARREGANEALDRIAASLEAWPEAGCDLRIAAAVVRIRDAATAELRAEVERLRARAVRAEDALAAHGLEETE